MGKRAAIYVRVSTDKQTVENQAKSTDPINANVAPAVRLKVRPNHRFDVKRCGTGSE